MNLSEIVAPNMAVARSINIERDLGDVDTLEQYILTEKGLEIISRLVAGMNGEKTSAWSLTGPYGMGKSAFANFLLSLCGPPACREVRKAKRLLSEKDGLLSKRFEEILLKQRIRPKVFFECR